VLELVQILLNCAIIITIIVTIMIGITVPSAFAETYNFYQDEYGIFSMNYPSGWHILHGDTGSVQFADSKSYWSNMISVFYYEDVFYNELSDNEIKQDIQRYEEEVCYSSTYETEGFICYDFQHHGTEKIKSNPLTFKTVISYVKEYSDDSTPQGIVGYVFDVVDKENSWNIASESMANGVSASEGEKFELMMSDVINSFTIKQKATEYTSLSNLPTLEYYYYVEPLPDWADSRLYDDAVDKAIQKISKENPWLSFRSVSYEDSEIDISWIKEYGTGNLGEAHSTIGSVHIQMGDSLCGYWLPHSEDMLADTIAHELLHGVGFDHVNNPKSIMYYEASDAVYEFEENGTFQLEDYSYQFIPFCTIKNTTDYFVDISSQEYGENFDVFFVKSASDAEKYANGDYFNKYSGCYDEGTSKFSKTCRNVSAYGGIVIGTDYISDGVVDLDLYISEDRYNSPSDYSLEKVEGLEYVLGVNANFESDRQNYNKAITIYKKILESNPNDTFALNNLGTVYDDLGDSAKAMQYYEKTLRLNPLDEFALSNIGATLQDQGKYEEAIEYYEKALDVNPESVFTLQMERDAKILLEESNGGGCLIATATYGSELSPQVQQLRELRDNQLLNTESGTAFMSTFNDIYYSFSPIVADYERENPLFKEVVKLAITPMISSLSLMENAESESEVLGMGLSVIMLNLGMYLGVPAVVIVGIRKNISKNIA
jgi:tetratricopeptide (TPR) repeat protein